MVSVLEEEEEEAWRGKEIKHISAETVRNGARCIRQGGGSAKDASVLQVDKRRTDGRQDGRSYLIAGQMRAARAFNKK